MIDAAGALTLAERALAERFPDADYAFAAGSILRGEGVALSDVDLVVMHGHVPSSWRESFTVEGVPFEAFVHDPETLAWIIRRDVREAGPSMLNMIAEGRIIGPRPDGAAEWQARMRAMVADGPPPMTAERIDDLRYYITDAVDDLRGDRSRAAKIALGVKLYPLVGHLILRGRGLWNGYGKWMPRRIAAIGPGLEERFTAAFETLFASGDAGPAIAFAEEVMAPHGGPLFDGYRRRLGEADRFAGGGLYDLEIRAERADDAAAVRAVVAAAFGEGKDTPDFVEQVRREAEVCLAEVAVLDGAIIGHAQWCAVPMWVDGRAVRGAYLACLSAAPAMQKRDIGSRLVWGGLARLRDAGFEAASLLGDPNYYSRFGFSSDLAERIDAPHRVRGRGFQAVALRPGVLDGAVVSADYPPVVVPDGPR